VRRLRDGKAATCSLVSRKPRGFPERKEHVGLGRVPHTSKSLGVVGVEQEDGMLLLLLMTRRSACVLGERVEEHAGDRGVNDDGAPNESLFAARARFTFHVERPREEKRPQDVGRRRKELSRVDSVELLGRQ
jgi:hypothetical protein